jgi:hypothetical protein
MNDNGTALGHLGEQEVGEKRTIRTRTTRLLRGMSVPTVVAGALLGLAACGSSPSSPGVATAGSTTTAVTATSDGGSGSGSQATGESQLLKYSQCMRAHGISDFPDPTSGGHLSIRIQPGSDLNPHDPQNVAAQSACKAYNPGGTLTPAQEAADNANALKYSHCMQSHGIADFPDPNGLGTITINVGGDLQPNSSRYEAAAKACQSFDTGFRTNTNDVSPPPGSGQGGAAQ